jgi:hypothetical protein
MGNCVTFYQPKQAFYSVQPWTVVVEVDGRPAPWLELVTIVRAKDPQLNLGQFRLSGHYPGPELRFENIAEVAHPGQHIWAYIVYTTDKATGYQVQWPLFGGVISQGSASILDTNETVEITAIDEIAYDGSEVIGGGRYLQANAGTVYVGAFKVIFNPDGLGNCSVSSQMTSGKLYHVFDGNRNTAGYWNYAKAIKYVISEYLDGNIVSSAELESLERQTEGVILRDVDITALTPLKAISRLCQRAGVNFNVLHVPSEEGRGKTVLQFYTRGQGREVTICHQNRGESLNPAYSNLVHCKIESATQTETIRVVGRGDVKRFESTFELVKGWDPSLEADNYELYSPGTNTNFLQVKDVFRKWVLNEAGDYSGAPYMRGEPYDLSEVFCTNSYGLKQRRFWPSLSKDISGRSFRYYLEVSYNDGISWRAYVGAFDILLDECGVYLSNNQLDIDIWIAFCKGKLRFRITASVDADESLEVIVRDGPINSSRRVHTVFFDMGNEYKYRQINTGSIFYNTNNPEVGLPDTVDDSENMRGQLRNQLGKIKQQYITGYAELAWVYPDIWPGDLIKGIIGKGPSFEDFCRPAESKPQIEKVEIFLADNWSTKIYF